MWIRLTLLLTLIAGAAMAEPRFILLQSTTSTENAGLFDALLPRFTQDTGIDVRVVAVGTGQALRNGRNGDGDVLLVHARAAEERFVAQGHGTARYDVMYNDFVLIGPKSDPAGIVGTADVTEALSKIAAHRAIFASRGDDSGTHQAEMRLWAQTDEAAPDASGSWYRETGSGMGATLNIAVAMGGYALTDRATWIAFGNKGAHEILLEGDPRLFNQYGVIPVSPPRHPHVRADDAQVFVNWLLSETGQNAIAQFKRDGFQLFFPNAKAASE